MPLPASCQKLLNAGPATKFGGSLNAVFSCMQAHGWRGFATYQPASRYWSFQGIETGIYVLLAAALIAVTFAIVRRRDAIATGLPGSGVQRGIRLRRAHGMALGND